MEQKTKDLRLTAEGLENRVIKYRAARRLEANPSSCIAWIDNDKLGNENLYVFDSGILEYFQETGNDR